MICPLLSIGTVVKQPGYGTDVEPCQEEDCAWWDDFEKKCAIKRIAKLVSAISASLEDR